VTVVVSVPSPVSEVSAILSSVTSGSASVELSLEPSSGVSVDGSDSSEGVSTTSVVVESPVVLGSSVSSTLGCS
jgi:hypothetical protein